MATFWLPEQVMNYYLLGSSGMFWNYFTHENKSQTTDGLYRLWLHLLAVKVTFINYELKQLWNLNLTAECLGPDHISVHLLRLCCLILQRNAQLRGIAIVDAGIPT